MPPNTEITVIEVGCRNDHNRADKIREKEQQHKDTLHKLRSLQYRGEVSNLGHRLHRNYTQRNDGSSQRPRGTDPTKLMKDIHVNSVNYLAHIGRKRPHKSLTPTCRASPCRGLNPGHPGGLVTSRPSGVRFIYLFRHNQQTTRAYA
eukprot:jgi/Chrzof1/3151/Cz12g13210.t1